MPIRKLVISVPHVIPQGVDNDSHPWDRLAYKVGKRMENILRENDIQVKLVRPTEGRELIDQNRPEAKDTAFRRRLRDLSEHDTLIVDLHSYEKNNGDFKDSQIEIFKFGNKFDKYSDFIKELLQTYGWKVYTVTNSKRTGHSDIVNEANTQGYPAVLVEVCEDQKPEDVAQALSTVFVNLIRGDNKMKDPQKIQFSPPAGVAKTMQEAKKKPYYELVRKKQRLDKIYGELITGKNIKLTTDKGIYDMKTGKPIFNEVRKLKRRINKLFEQLKEPKKIKVNVPLETHKETLFRINKLERRIDDLSFKEKLRPKDATKLNALQNKLYKLYEGINKEGISQPGVRDGTGPRAGTPECTLSKEEIVQQDSEGKGAIEKDYPQAGGPGNRIEESITQDEFDKRARRLLDGSYKISIGSKTYTSKDIGELANRLRKLKLLKENNQGETWPDDKFDPHELAMGIKVEMEHTDNLEVAKKIAKDHLLEFPDYYTRLKKMEEQGKNHNPLGEKKIYKKKEQYDEEPELGMAFRIEQEKKMEKLRERIRELYESGKYLDNDREIDVGPGPVIPIMPEEREPQKEGYISFKNPYHTLQALHILSVNNIDAMPRDGRLFVDRKDESKVRDIFKKFGFNTPIFEEGINMKEGLMHLSGLMGIINFSRTSRDLKKVNDIMDKSLQGGKITSAEYDQLKDKLEEKESSVYMEYGLAGWQKRLDAVHSDLGQENPSGSPDKPGLPKYWLRGESVKAEDVDPEILDTEAQNLYSGKFWQLNPTQRKDVMKRIKVLGLLKENSKDPDEEEPDTSYIGENLKELKKRLKERRIYWSPGMGPKPKGVTMKKGLRGGMYYDVATGKKPEKAEPVVSTTKAIKLLPKAVRSKIAGLLSTLPAAIHPEVEEEVEEPEPVSRVEEPTKGPKAPKLAEPKEKEPYVRSKKKRTGGIFGSTLAKMAGIDPNKVADKLEQRYNIDPRLIDRIMDDMEAGKFP